MKQSVKDTVLEIREIVFGEHDIDIETYAVELSDKSSLTFDEIKNVFNNLSLIYIQSKNPKLTQSKKKSWEAFEDAMIMQYVELVMRDGGSKREALVDLQSILVDRSESSIPFRYYHKTNPKNNKQPEKVAKAKLKYVPDITHVKTEKSDDDLLDIVVDIVDNVDTAQVDVTALFKGILNLSQKAVHNSNVEKVEILEGKIAFLENELDSEKNKNDMLQLEVSKVITEFDKVKNEINYFDTLNGKQKLQQLQNFNRRIKVIVDKFGGVIAVGE